jgi:hypothetical protein
LFSLVQETIESLMRDLSDAITERDDALKSNQLLTHKSESLIEALDNALEESKAKEESEVLSKMCRASASIFILVACKGSGPFNLYILHRFRVI